MNPAGATPHSAAVGGAWRVAARRAEIAFWVAVVPAVVAWFALRYFVPPTGTGARGVVAALGQRYLLLLGLALYFALSLVARYWFRELAGARWAWAKQAALYQFLRSPGGRKEIERSVPADKASDLDGRLADLRVALDSSPADQAAPARAAAAIESLAASVFERRRWRSVLVFAAVVLGAGVAAYAFRSFVAQPYRVLSSSMLPTLEPADLVAGRVRPYGSEPTNLPRRGDVVVFPSAAVGLDKAMRGAPEVLVKRVIGVPGDRVSMRGAAPILNGWQVPSCDAGEYFYALPTVGDPGLRGRLLVEFLEDRVYLAVYSPGTAFQDTYVVKPGEVFVLGDNRANSLDSRAYNGGHGAGVPVAAIDARVQSFLVGSLCNGDADLGRLFGPVDGLHARLRIAGLETERLETGVARCLKERPKDTSPPRP